MTSAPSHDTPSGTIHSECYRVYSLGATRRDTVIMGAETAPRRRLSSPTVLAGSCVTVGGYLVAAVSTHLAIAAGERPVTLLPAWAGGQSLVAIAVFRALLVVLVGATVWRWRPRQFVAALLVGGLLLTGLGVWQTWVMLART